MIKFVKKQNEKIAIVVDAVDRLQRGFKETPMLDDLINKKKIELHFFRENMVINEDSKQIQKIMWDMSVLMAKSYVGALAENVKRSENKMLEEGLLPGTCPLGYLNVDNIDKRKKVILDPQRSHLVKKLFEEYYKLYLENTSHYIFLSTYRIYADEYPITENSLRLLEAEKPSDFVSFEEYSIYKAEEEDLLRSSEYRHFTIVRPAITYSSRRFQLVTLEMPNTVGRAMVGKRVVLPKTARDVQATMTWAGDVAQMIATILFNKQAIGQTYTVSTAEHHTWGEVAEYYRELIGMEVIWADEEDYLAIVGGTEGAWRQLHYDRLFDRIVDNSKILELMGKTQSDLMPLYEGLKKEIGGLTPEMLDTPTSSSTYCRMDAWLAEHDGITG
jgi:nucleoside-diphosphate-sugar epimerase